MRRDQVHTGLLVKLLTDYSNVPAGTLATVDSTGTIKDEGTWWFTVRWRHYRPIPNKFPRGVTEYSLNLWETDLELFEVVSARQVLPKIHHMQTPKLGLDLVGRRLSRRGGTHPNQLSLFLADDF
jgi:hypothetical protein